MINDLFVNKNIKNQYIDKPISISEFVRLIEERNNIVVHKEIKKVLKSIYPNSYETKFKVLNITGPRASGKTFLSYIVILYDAYRTMKLKTLAQDKFLVQSIGNTKLQIRLLGDILSKIKSFPYMPKIIVNDFNETNNIDGNIFIADEPNVVTKIRSSAYDLAYNKFLLNKNNINHHFITIADIKYDKNSYDIADDTLLVNLSGVKK